MNLINLQENKNISSCIIQATSKQDFIATGIVDDKSFKYIIVADTHGGLGNRKFIMIDKLKSISWDTLLLDKDWKISFIDLMGLESSYRIGSTFTLLKIYEDRFIIDWIGDSSAKIYCDNKLVWETLDHDYNNKDDIKRLINNGFVKKKSWDIMVIDSTTIKSIPSFTFNKNGDALNMTRSLGHNGIFIDKDNNFNTKVIVKEKEKKYKCIVGSDGLWQMTCEQDNNYLSSLENDANNIADFAYNRWTQKWIHDNTYEKVKDVEFPKSNIDDIAVAVYID